MEQDQRYAKFRADCERAGMEVTDYRGRFWYVGPAVATGREWPTLQDVIRATSVEVQWDDLGLGHIVYPR